MTARRARLVLVWALTLSAALTPATGLAQTDPVRIAERAAGMLDAAATSLAEADGADNRVAALTETVRAYEAGLLALREGVRQAAQRERAILVVFEVERDRLSRLLGALQAMGRAPAPLLMLHPSGPLGTARSGMILSDVSPAIATQAGILRGQLDEVTRLRTLQDEALGRLAAGLAGAQAARAELSQAIAERRVLPGRFELDTEAMLQLMESVESLQGFADSLRATSGGPGAQTAALPGFATARGRLDLPVIGRVLRRFDQADAAGIARPGLVLATQSQAIVTAPWPATVRYAGPLLEYGTVVILEPQGDYLLVLAGMAEVFVRAGDVVTEDAPLGLMGGAMAQSGNVIITNAQDGGGDLSQTLYMELREAGRPVDPEAWFITNRDGG